MRYAACFTPGLLLLLLLATPLRAQYATTLPDAYASGAADASVPAVTSGAADASVPAFSATYERVYAGGKPQALPAQALPAQALPAQALPALLPGEVTEGRKSAFVAVLYSLALPGMGELYAGRFDRGKYPLILEAGLWLGLIGVNSYGNWVEDDARLFAVQHAGINAAGKEDDYFVDIENYSDLYDYNNQMLVERRLEDVYPDESAWRWDWDSEENRLDYKDQRIFADELHNGVTFFVLGMVANRIWSAIQAEETRQEEHIEL
ncbi:MAG: hypothetical protein RRA94_06900, partial [Bacteroidota bacterium]|nr:hypothetical protein [Bacteroidota bacterium]